MNVQTIGASKRPKLSLAYGSTPGPSAEHRAATLPDHELRRIVAAMIG
jgi:hypothetical protein